MIRTLLWGIIAAAIGVLVSTVPVRAADVNNFTIDTYTIDYTLGRDADGRSTLRTKETITATFPNSDQNHGIERFIPKTYDGHSTSLDIVAVTKHDGARWEYTTYESGGYRVVRIGDADKYVHGQHTFVIEYTQRDVTKEFADTGASEFYWDTNGTAWSVPITSLQVSLQVDESLQSSLNGQAACYRGRYASKAHCELKAEGTTYTVSGSNLSARENITISLGFATGTFAPYEPSLWERLAGYWIILQIVGSIAAVLVIIALAVRFSSWSRRTKELGTIVPEYTPPRDTSVTVSGKIATSQSAMSAQLIDLAVRHYIKIYEMKPKSAFSPAEYELEIIKPISTLLTEEQELLKDLFKNQVAVGSKRTTKELRSDTSLSLRLVDNPKKLQAAIRHTYELKAQNSTKTAWFKTWAKVFLAIGIVTLTPMFLVTALVAYVMGRTLWPLTDRGLDLRRYLEGLKLYIKVGEKERLAMLQSPEGAEKVQVDTTDPKKLVVLYERVLPYAVLFGQEKEWNKRLGSLYETANTQPDWYTGSNMAVFNAAVFTAAMSDLSTSIESSGASHSSSGGSSGGGFSGGGGGGGGGGGW